MTKKAKQAAKEKAKEMTKKAKQAAKEKAKEMTKMAKQAAIEKAKEMTKKALIPVQMNIKKCGCNCNVEVPIIIKGTLTPFILKWDCNKLFDIVPSNNKYITHAYEYLEKNTGIKITDKDGKALKNLDCMKLIDQLKSKIRLEKKGDEIVLFVGKAKTIIPKLWIKNMNEFGIKYKDLLLALDTFKCKGNFNVPCEKNQNIKNTNSCVSNKKKQKGGADYPASFKKQPYGGGRKKSARKNKQRGGADYPASFKKQPYGGGKKKKSARKNKQRGGADYPASFKKQPYGGGKKKKSARKNKQKGGYNYEYPGKELSGKGWPYQRTDFPYKVGTNLDEKYLF